MSVGDTTEITGSDGGLGSGGGRNSRVTRGGTFPRSFGSKYQLLQHLATGGMADVFLARQIGTAGFVKECVIKRILPHLAVDQQFVTMFLDEARLCARLSHPNIASVFDHGIVAGPDGDEYFMAMEYVDGVDLEMVLDKAHQRGEGRLPYKIAARIVAAIADALDHAHKAVDENGQPLCLVHRDVTPSNIVVSFDGVPKLLDFGIAKAASKQAKTQVGIIKGKVPYMSPEQVQGETLDGRSDIFSLGAILFEVTTGEKPFGSENPAQIGLRILQEEPTPPTLLVADYPEVLERIVSGALAKRAGQRTPNGRVMQQQLERFLVELGVSVTSHDVAEYLASRVPRQRIQHPMPPAPATPEIKTAADPNPARRVSSSVPSVPAGSIHPREERASMSQGPPVLEESSHRPQPTGQLSIGDPSLLGAGDELGAGNNTRRSLGGGGSKWTGLIIGGLILATGGVMFVLRGYEMKKEAAAGVAPGEGAALGVPAPAPAPSSATGPHVTPAPAAPSAPIPVAAPPQNPAPSHAAAPSVAAPAPPSRPAPDAPPKVTPLPPSTKTVSAKPHHVTHPAATPSTPSHGLPHLPSLPPATE